MTKIVSILLSCVIALAAFTSCGSAPDSVDLADGGEGKAVVGIDGGEESRTESRKESQTESQTDEEAPLSDYRPMVYVYDEFYYDSDFVEELPEGARLIGSIEKQLDQTERPEENFVSNSDMAAQGCQVYAGEDTTVIYVEWTGSEKSGYMVFTSDVEEASRKK